MRDCQKLEMKFGKWRGGDGDDRTITSQSWQNGFFDAWVPKVLILLFSDRRGKQ